MARYTKDVELEPFPRELLDEAVRTLMDAAADVPVSERGIEFGDEVLDTVRLVEGRHLAPGARYRIETGEGVADVGIAAWNKVGESRIDVTVESGGHSVDLQVVLRMAGTRLHTVRVTGGYQGPKPFRGLRRAKWEGELLAEEWWSPAGAKASSPLSLRVVHPFAGAGVRMARRKDRRGRWVVRIAARYGGRSLLRPVAAVGLAVMRGRLRPALEKGIADVASQWNAVVPDAAKHGIRERLEFEHRVELPAMSREWAEAYVAALHRGITESPLKRDRLAKKSDKDSKVRLLKGKHAEPGSRYRVLLGPDDEVDPLDVSVTAWEFDGRNRIEFSSPDAVQKGWVEVDSARRPTLARAALTGEVEGFTQVDCEAELDLGRWWAGTGEDAALTATASNPLGTADLAVRRVPTADGDWTAHITAGVEGRGWTRRLVAAGGLLAAIPMGYSFRLGADGAALNWYGLVAETKETSPQDAADATLRKLFGPTTG
ncbi:hypothetical protein [Actinomadura monticuli]|uniref:SRPBCC family protein n=1 Tax=Actinomadura monticuli TaxID=3097367 RepID=A0ABV4Q516_9ACTN